MKKFFKYINQKLFLEGPNIDKHSSVESPSSSEMKNKVQSEKKNVSATDKRTELTTPEKEQVQNDKADRCRTQPNLHQGNPCKVFLGGIPEDVTETDIRKVFEKYGKIKDVFIAVDKNTNKSKRFGFLQFENEESAKESLNTRFEFINGKRVEVKQAWARGCPKAEVHDDKKETNHFVDREKIHSFIKDLEKLTGCSLKSTTSTDSESHEENDQTKYQELFDDYFKAKYTLQTLFGSDNSSNVPGNGEIKCEEQYEEETLEKTLTGFYVSGSKKTTVGGNYPDFSSNYDDTDSTEDDVDYYFTKNDSATGPDHLGKPFSQPSEKSVCRVCNLTLSDNSAHSFFAHCNTPIHKQKMKERFEKNEMFNKPQNKQNLVQKNLNNITSSESEKIRVKKKKTRRRQLKRSVNNPPGKSQKDKDVNKITLREIMTSLQVETDESLKCKICDEVIPKAADLPLLMANLLNHLQSKGHLAKIRNLENSSQKEPKVTFRCLYCNYFCSKHSTFSTHLNSDSHFAKTVVKSSSEPSLEKALLQSIPNQVTSCPTCKKCFCGPPVEIKNHFIRCSVQKSK